MKLRLALAVVAGFTLCCAGCVPAPLTSAKGNRSPPLPTPVPVAATTRPGTIPATGTAVPSTSSPTTGPSTAAMLLTEARGWAFRARSVPCLATGSGFAMDGHIVTNRHVASGSAQLQFSTWDGKDFQADIAAISAGPDLAILDESDVPSASTTARAASSNPAPGTPVWAAGYPEGGQLSLLPGSVIGYLNGAPLGARGRVMEITNLIEPGNSGSALLDGAGQVVGVVFAKVIKTGDGLAIPVSELQRFLARPGTIAAGACE